MKLNNSQKYMYDKISHDLDKYIQDFTDKINAVSKLAFYPKKDGTEKVNFALNFGTINGEKYTINWSPTHHEERRWVDITKHLNSCGNFTGVEMRIAPTWDEKHEKQIIPYTSHDIWFNWNIFENYLKPETAKQVFDLIKGPYYNYLVCSNLEYIRVKENFDSYFEMLCNAATNLHNSIKFLKVPVFSSYAYNLQGRDNHYLIENYFDED